VIAYLDTSVVLRLLLAEPSALQELPERGVTSALTEVEVLRTLDRLRHVEARPEQGLVELRERAFALLALLDVVELSHAVLRRASNPFPTLLRTLDALHVATALLWRDVQIDEPLAFATHDAAQAAAARALGFAIVGC
jgi:predicted nucleic acid-binding protein